MRWIPEPRDDLFLPLALSSSSMDAAATDRITVQEATNSEPVCRPQQLLR